jgi:hypothetical protein
MKTFGAILIVLILLALVYFMLGPHVLWIMLVGVPIYFWLTKKDNTIH